MCTGKNEQGMRKSNYFCSTEELLYKLLSAISLRTEGTNDEKWIYLQRNVWYTVVVSIYVASLLKLLKHQSV